MKNCTTSNSVQTYVTKAVNNHNMYPDLFVGSHLLTMQKPASVWYVIERFIGTIAQQSVYYTLLDVVRSATCCKEQDRICVDQS